MSIKKNYFAPLALGLGAMRRAAMLLLVMLLTATVGRSATIDLSDANGDFNAIEDDVLTGTTSHTVTIADGANITLSGATITGGIVCNGTATITLVGTNSVSVVQYNKAGIQIGGNGTTLTIRGSGSLTATGGSAAAGIGLGRTWDASVTAGAIVIEGGTVNASGDIGIGIGTVGNSQTATIDGISIKGGTVSASLGKGYIYNGSTATVGYIKIYDTIDMVDASKITETVTYMHVDGESATDVTANKTDYFTIGENGDRRIIVPKDDTDYTITIADGIEHGTLTVAAATAKYMQTVTVTATPAFGYRFVRLIVKDAQNNDVASTNNTFQMPKGGATVSAVFEQGVHGTTEFVWGYPGPDGFVNEANIYDGVTTVNLQQTGQSYQIWKYNEYTNSKFRLDNNTYEANIPYAGGTGEFYEIGNATNFSLNYDGQTGYYDITMTDVGNGKWGVSILPTAAQMDVVPDQTYTGSAITPEPLVIAGSLSLTKGEDYTYSYENNTNVGTATVRATFQGTYVSLGYVEKTFNIVYPTVTTSYVDADGTLHKNVIAIPLDNTMTTLAAGTYVVNSDVAYTGSVSFNGPATLILGDGATMSVNQTVNGGNALFVYADAPLTIYGQAEGTGTLTATAADMPGIFTQSNITISGGTIYASSYGIGGIGSVTIADGIVYTDGTGATYDGTLTSDEINAIANKTLTKGMNWTDLKTAMTAGGTQTVTLTNNVIRINSERIEPSGTVTLDLNGYTIDGGTSQTNPLFSVNNGVSMTITDSQTGGNLCNSGTNPTVSVNGGTLTLAAGTINAQSNGVYVFDGSFTMTGGTITGGTVSGVGLSSNGSFTMTGGTITGNDVGVDVNSATAMFIVSGNVSIVDNTTKDVSLNYDNESSNFNPIHIGGALNEAARIGINIDDYAANAITGNVVMVFTDGLKDKGTKQNFVLNGRAGLALATTESGEIALGAIYTLTLPSAATVSGYTAEQDAPVGSVAYKVPCGDVVTINYTGAVTEGKSVRFTIPNGTITYLDSTDGQGKCITFTMPGSNATISKDADEQDYTFANITLKERFENGNSYGLQATLDGSSLATISIPTAISVTGVTLNRTFTPGKPATLMLPFNTTYWGEEHHGASFHTFTGVTFNETTQKWEATMTELDKGDGAYNGGALVANTPYIVVPTASSITLTNGGTLCTAEGGGQETKPSGSNWTFKGTYSYMKWTTDTSDPDYNAERADEIGKAYGFAGKEKTDIEVGDFVRVASGAKIRPMGCYLLWSDTQNAARRMTRGAADSELPQRITVRLVSSNGETTAIGELDTKTGEISMDGWWTLDGIKLSGKPSSKGIYINNGKKIVIK